MNQSDDLREDVSGIREQLAEVLHRAYADVTHGSPFSGAIKYPMADAILARWDLAEKPVVTATQLGRMCRSAVLSAGESHDLDKRAGLRMRDQLASAGLTIVRIKEGV